jgi:NADH-quinone oxidoreductase subunit L
LTKVFEHNKALWVLGVVTAILTAYYMSRLFVLTFRGTERFREVTKGRDPHESPWVMTLPLVVLAVLAVLGGLINLPWAHSTSLAGFLDPTFGFVPAVSSSSTIAQWGLALVDVVAAVLGLLAAFSIWRGVSESPRFESSFFEHVWHWDDFYDDVIGRPLTRTAQYSDDVIEPKVIDGAVTGVAVATRRSAEGLRKVQSGFVRQYALAMVLGVAVIIVYLVARVH